MIIFIFYLYFQDDRSPISSANESDESSDIDSPGPSLLKNQNQIVLDSTQFKNAPPTTVSTSLLTPTPSAANSQSQTSTKQQTLPETTAKNSTISSKMADGNILKSSTQTQKNMSSAGSTMGPSSSYNNVVYPAASLSSVPQEVLLQLIQSGHLQLHTEEGISIDSFKQNYSLNITLHMSPIPSNVGTSILSFSNVPCRLNCDQSKRSWLLLSTRRSVARPLVEEC